MQMANDGKLPKLVYHNTVTMEYNATNSNPFTLQLPTIGNYVIAVFVDSIPDAPDTGSIALSWCKSCMMNGEQHFGQILRANGTIGTDPWQVSYDIKSGVLRLGGTYGAFAEGLTYHIYAFEID